MADDPAATRIGMQVLPRLGGPGAPAVGGEIAGYRLEAVLGRGGMGIVFRAEHRHLGRTVALKVLAPHLAADDDFRRRFVHESQAAAALDHPNIVAVHDAGEARGHLYLAMQYVPGEDLGDALRPGPLDPARAVAVLSQVASALDAAHAAGLVHRDVKPGNVLLAGDHAYLTDFGLATRAAAATRITAPGQVIGTADYLAPEQVDGKPVDARADVYALGCLLFHCLTGRPPFERESAVQVLYAHVQASPPSACAVRPGLPGGFDDVVARALAKAPDARFPTCTALIGAARAALEGAARRARQDGLPRVLVAAQGTSRSLIRASLGPEDLALDEVPGGTSVVDAALASAPAVVLVDAGAGFGPEACRALRDDPRTTGTRVIPVVARADRDLGRRMVDAGAYDYLSVPFSTMQLLVKVRDALAARG